MSSANAVLNPILNTVGEAGYWVFDNSKSLVIPAALGAMGGWLAGVGMGPGLVQGAASGALYSYILSPLGTRVSKSPTEGPNKISQNAKYFWYTAGVLANIALPILFASNLANPILKTAGSYLPSFINNMIQPNDVEYTLFKGVLVNILPAITQWSIKAMRHEDPRRI